MASYLFHSEAADEYLAATRYYLDYSNTAGFSHDLASNRRTSNPALPRKTIPYSLYYRWEPEHDRVSVYAVMHFSRRPGYWRDRTVT